MPAAVKDVVNSFVNKADPFVRFTLKNPLSASLTLSILICLLLIWIFKDDDISKRRIKLVKMFVYSFFITTTIFFLQNSHLLKERAKKTDIILPDGVLNGSTGASDPGYVKLDLKMGGSNDSVDFMIT